LIRYIFFIVLIGSIFVSCLKKDRYLPGYYQDTEIKNSKAMHKATMKPYTINGIKYYPKSVKIGDTFKGTASWYGEDFHKKLTSNGETYNMYALTAAHKTLPMNTMLKVTNLDNNKQIIVRVNDRGPFVDNRIIDLSKKAATLLGMRDKGLAHVKLEVVGFNGRVSSNAKPPVVRNKTNSTNQSKQEKTSYFSPKEKKYYLQVGVYSIAQGAKEVAKKLKIIIGSSKKVYKILVGTFKTKKEAKLLQKNFHFRKAFIIEL
jgi:rare lipoprotein A